MTFFLILEMYGFKKRDVHEIGNMGKALKFYMKEAFSNHLMRIKTLDRLIALTVRTWNALSNDSFLIVIDETPNRRRVSVWYRGSFLNFTVHKNEKKGFGAAWRRVGVKERGSRVHFTLSSSTSMVSLLASMSELSVDSQQ